MSESMQPWRGRAVLHVDLDAFFASVEQLDHPEWRGRPVIVGGSPTGRGVVSTASYEARRYGIHSAMSAAQAATRAPDDAVWASPRFERYSQISRAVMDIMRDVAPALEQVSVDEAFLDVTPSGGDSPHPVSLAQRIKNGVVALGLTCSVGVATSKTVAKIASDHEKPDGLTVVEPGNERDFLGPLPIRDMSGIGPRTATRLSTFGIHTLGDLAVLDEQTARDIMGSSGPELVRRCNGIDPRPVGRSDPTKSVSNERTFSQDIRDRGAVEAVVRGLCEKVASRLRRKGLAGRTVTVKVRFADFTTRTAQRTLDAPTDLESEMLPVADQLLDSMWSPGVGIRLLGVGSSGFDTVTEQLGLFETGTESDGASGADGPRSRPQPDRERARRLAVGMDAVRERFGSNALKRGATDLPEPQTQPDPKPDDA